MTLGFLGTGTITAAIITGLGGADDPIVVSPRNADVAADLARRFPNVSIAASNQDVLDRCEIAVIAVRPQIVDDVLPALRFRPDHAVISLVSGLPVRRIANMVAPATRISRAVPLPAAARKRSPTAVYPEDPQTVALFSRVGEAFAVDTEDRFDALCTATATMAAYFSFCGAAASWLFAHGVAEQQARDYMAHIFAGLAATAIRHPGQSYAALALDHATKGGTNEQVVNHLTANGVFRVFEEALDGILKRVTAASR